MEVLESFEIYTREFGWKVIPVYGGTKVPVGECWNWFYDRPSARKYLGEHPDASLGLLLGKIIDVEADSQHANELLSNLVAGHSHPMYKSARSVHHLFLNLDSNLTKQVFSGIEFRGHLHQSLIPPSPGRKWLTNLRIPIPDVPPKLASFYWRNKLKKNLKPGFVLAFCSKCETDHAIHKNRYKLEARAFGDMGLKWFCRFCRKVDVRPACRVLRRITKCQ